jgi:hypothetical protein
MKTARKTTKKKAGKRSNANRLLHKLTVRINLAKQTVSVGLLRNT